MNPAQFENYKAPALRMLQAIGAYSLQFATLLEKLQTIRDDSWSEPAWYVALRESHDALLKAQSLAMRTAEVRQGG